MIKGREGERGRKEKRGRDNNIPGLLGMGKEGESENLGVEREGGSGGGAGVV